MAILITWQDDSGQTQFVSFDVVTSETPEYALEITEHPVEEGANVSDHAREQLVRLSMEGYVSNKPLLSNYVSHRGGMAGADSLEDPPEYVSVDLLPEFPPPGSTVAPVITPGGLSGRTVQFVESLFSEPVTRATVLRKDAFQNRVQRTLELLLDAQQGKRLVEISGGVRDHEDMLIESLSVPRTPEDGNGATFSVTFKQVRLVSSETVAAPRASELRAQSAGVSRGSAATKAATKEGDRKAELESTLSLLADGSGLSGALGI